MPVAASLPMTDAEPAVRLMLVDDDPMGLLLTARALRERGFEVLDFDRPDDAFAALGADGIDCVVADVLTPGMDGFEFCRRVRAMPRGEALPVLMLSSLDEDEATRHACEADAPDYCIKSGNRTLLAHPIRRKLHMARLERDAGRGRAAPGPAMQAAPVGAFDWQPDAWRMRGSADLFRLLDWHDPPASLHDRHLLALIAPGDRRGLRRAMARLLGAALEASGVPADRMEVELTESGMMRDAEVAVAELTALRALGAGLAVDDFGTGYSSLADLTRLRLTTLEIERSFVHDIDTSERRRAVARTIVELGANLHLRVVAEGVETDSQRRVPIELGGPMQQGWLFGRALPIDEALAFADAHGVAATELAA